MDIQTFVAETLVQIVAGVAEAKSRIDGMGVGAKVNPEYRPAASVKDHTEPSPVKFDIAVTVVNENETGSDTKNKGAATAGVLAVVGVRIGAEIGDRATSTERNEVVSRVQFEVAISQPGEITRGSSSRDRGSGGGGGFY